MFPSSLRLPIVTQQSRVPWLWVVLVNLSWFNLLYCIFVTGVALPLTLRRFTDDTRLIAWVTSIGGLMGIIIGPLCNYLSDRLWTRWGRRRPFLILAGLGTLSAMVFTPFLDHLWILVILVVASSLLGDVGSTLEPLWLEVVPGQQRGTGFAMRSAFVNLASLCFFQVMFAQMDKQYAWDLSALSLGTLSLNGEQLTYLLGAVLQTVTLALLVFGIREQKPSGVDLKRFREIEFSPWAFTKGFVLSVFSEKRWWPVYLFYTAPMAINAGVLTFSNLMLIEQFKYDKPTIALSGLPTMLVSILVVTPIWGRLADKMNRLPLAPLGLGVALSAGVTVWILHLCADLMPMQLPSLWMMIALNLSVLGACGGAGLLLVQVFNRLAPGINPRLWPWFLNALFFYLTAVGTYALIRLSPDGVPTITHWFLATIISSGFLSLQILSGPLLYEYIPVDKIGTLLAGCGLLGTAVTYISPVLLGYWIFYYTRLAHGVDAPKDYASLYIFNAILGAVALAGMVWFFQRAARGRYVEYGKLRLNSDGTPLQAEDSKTT